ncbi:LacI family transcriptional regulator [Paenibacillus psychroresistens]|uniref:LacI family transcriptional regulator n=1 Tax=Paenibacillus psychroresistens TaxID=1778678 RepID=A0A6B8RF11_9BACL|nr:LacI family DNA-binding transcriptional regulator [Paenibacillus psychroresistens]QGQ94739.1 LacI family transcriptional regulator [Paenibacillus psychroresistens]
MAYTIKEVAARAGVSKSTVSRVISNTGYTSQIAREKVLQVIEELQYKPNAVARAMVSQRTNNIGVIIYREHHPIASHPFYGKILDSVLTAAGALDYSVFVTTDQEMSLRSADYMLEKRVDGLILISRLRQNVIDYIRNFKIPYIMVNGSTEDQDVIHIVNQDEVGGQKAAEYLFKIGHRKIFIIAGPQEHRSHHMRFNSFRAYMEQQGNNIETSSIFYSTASTFEKGYQAMADSMENLMSHSYTAIFATNDMLALGAMKYLQERAVRIPEQMAIMGFDDIDFADMVTPSLTTIHVEKGQMGHESVMILDRLIKKQTVLPERIEYEPRLVVRQST